MQGTAVRAHTHRALLAEIRDNSPSDAASNVIGLPQGTAVLESSRLVLAEAEHLDLHLEAFACLVDPVREKVGLGADANGNCHLDVFFHPGVTDAEGDMASEVMALSGYPSVRCRSGLRHYFGATVPFDLRVEVENALGNPLIQRFLWSDETLVEMNEQDAHPPAILHERFEPANLSVGELMELSKTLGLGLSRTEMAAIADYFGKLGRPVSDVELQSIALAWSEHCSHKTFKATIRHRTDDGERAIQGMLSELIAAPSLNLRKPWVRSAFADNAGIIAFDETHDIAVKVETHNHPSALEPYGGAHTGVGGVIRDILAVSAEPIANTDVLCFGPLDLLTESVPAGTRHPRQTFAGVVRGIADYGNNMGIPTVGGAVLFEPGFVANPLVFCGTLGILPTGSHPCSPGTGDLIVLLGGRTGRDGLHGAAMSSASLDMGTRQRSTVQIGNPITEKTVRDVLPHLRDERLYTAITDCGAGGLCSAVGEMGVALGFDCDLDLVPLKYDGLLPWEIWLSEAQERMILAVPPSKIGRVGALCQEFGVETTVIGAFRDHGCMRLFHDGRAVADLSLSFMHGGCPTPTLPSVAPAREGASVRATAGHLTTNLATTLLLRLLAHPNIASKEHVIRRYDHEVGGATVVKPLTLRSGPSDGAVLKPLTDSWRGVVITHGINPRCGEDPRAMALMAVDEALRNLVAVGGSIDHAALLDNFSWGDVDGEESLGRLVEAAIGCRTAISVYGVPFISGKDSLRNCADGSQGRRSIPGTLLITTVGVVPDVRRCVTMDLKAAGNNLYLIGATRDELGGSHLAAVADRALQLSNVLPTPGTDSAEAMRKVAGAVELGLLMSCHDISEGGLAVAVAEMAIAGGLGVELQLRSMSDLEANLHPIAALFSETGGRFICEVNPSKAAEFEEALDGVPVSRIGVTTDHAAVTIRLGDDRIVDVPLEDAESAWRTALDPAAAGKPVGSTAPAAMPDLISRQQVPAKAASRLRPQIMVLSAAGINCDRETVDACALAGADVELVHINQVLTGRRCLDDFAALILPGGFSFGDHLGAGAVLAATLRSSLLHDLEAFAQSGRPVLGICNGFQVLARLGLLGPISLAPNAHGRFECRWVRLQAAGGQDCRLLDGLEDFWLPIAHGEGRVMVDPEFEVELRGYSPIRYVENPNGSFDAIAGVRSCAGNVLGLMPHPERFVLTAQHPAGPAAANVAAFGEPAGLRLFRNLVSMARLS